MSTLIKICGIRDLSTLNTVIQAGANFAGFVHCEASPRHVDLPQIHQFIQHARGRIHTVVLCVNPNDALLEAIAKISPDYVQLHGAETPQRVADIAAKFPFKIIKAIGIETAQDLAQTAQFPHADLLLLDAKAPLNNQQTGGHGKAFDWDVLKGFQSPKPFLLAGGLTPENVTTAIAQIQPFGVDVSSGVESSKGIKSAAKIQLFIDAARLMAQK